MVYYTPDQLDELCEKIIGDFCMARYGQELNPIPTEALLQLLKEYTHGERIESVRVLRPA